MANISLCCRKVRERPKATPMPWGKVSHSTKRH